MSRVVVEHDVGVALGGDRVVDAIEGLAKLHASVSCVAVPDDLARDNTERREQGRRAVSDVAGSAPLGLPRSHGEQWLCPIESLDLLTDDWLNRQAGATERVLQCVASAGNDSSVFVITRSTSSSRIVRGTPGRGSSLTIGRACGEGHPRTDYLAAIWQMREAEVELLRVRGLPVERRWDQQAEPARSRQHRFSAFASSRDSAPLGVDVSYQGEPD